MPGTVTFTDQVFADKSTRPVRKFSINWTSDASGDVSGTLTVPYLSGFLLRVVFIPGAGGVQPDNGYDVTLLDESGIDVLGGTGADLSNASTTHVAPGVPLTDGTTTTVMPPAIDDRLELVVENAGNANSGVVVLYVQ